MKNNYFYEHCDSYPFYVDVEGVYYAAPNEDIYDFVWLGKELYVKRVINDTLTRKVYYELEYYKPSGKNTLIVEGDVICKERLHELIDKDIVFNLIYIDLFLLYIKRAALAAPHETLSFPED